MKKIFFLFFIINLSCQETIPLDDEEPPNCSICWQGLKENYIEPYRCDHKYHKICTDKWPGSCPLCRAPQKISPNTNRRILLLQDINNGNEIVLNQLINEIRLLNMLFLNRILERDSTYNIMPSIIRSFLVSDLLIENGDGGSEDGSQLSRIEEIDDDEN